MALTEKQYINKIEFLHTGDVQVRESTEVYRDEQMIAQEYHRRVVSADEQLDGPLAERLQGIQLEVVAERNSLREEKAQLEADKQALEADKQALEAEIQSLQAAKDAEIQKRDEEIQALKQEIEALKNPVIEEPVVEEVQA
jgi:Skp family chaperone for outer membrane proteins